MILVRPYQARDAVELMQLFHDTVQRVNCRDYTPEQLAAWSPAAGLDPTRWAERFAGSQPLVAVADNQPVGFAELRADGHVDCFYAHYAWQRRGVGGALMNELLRRAQALGLARLDAHVSLTARAFFEHYGFVLLRPQQLLHNGVQLTNLVMERVL